MTFSLVFGFVVLIGGLVGINALSQQFGKRFFYKQIQDDLALPRPNPHEIGKELQRATAVIKRWDGILSGSLLVAMAFFPVPLVPKVFFLFVVLVIGVGSALGRDRKLDETTAVSLMRDFSHEFMRSASKERIEALLEGMLLMEGDGLVRLGIQRIRDWGGGNALRMLENTNFPDSFAHRSLASDAAQLLRTEMEEAGSGKLNKIAGLLEGKRIDRNVYWSRLVDQIAAEELGMVPAVSQELLLAGQEAPDLASFKEDASESKPIRDFLLWNVPLAKEIKEVICERCFVRAEHWREYNLVRCPRCMEADRLKVGAKRVVGTIDGRRIGLQKNGDYVVQLWKEGEQQTKIAEIDELVVWGRKEMNYSWAINASVEAIRNEFPDKNFKVEVNLHERVELDANTLQLLEAFAGGPPNIFSDLP